MIRKSLAIVALALLAAGCTGGVKAALQEQATIVGDAWAQKSRLDAARDAEVDRYYGMVLADAREAEEAAIQASLAAGDAKATMALVKAYGDKLVASADARTARVLALVRADHVLDLELRNAQVLNAALTKWAAQNPTTAQDWLKVAEGITQKPVTASAVVTESVAKAKAKPATPKEPPIVNP